MCYNSFNMRELLTDLMLKGSGIRLDQIEFGYNNKLNGYRITTILRTLEEFRL